MSHNDFRQEVIEKNGDFFHVLLDQFFHKAIELAQNDKFEEAIEIGNDALVLAKYSNVGYELIYLLGMLCEAYIDNNQPEIAMKYFKCGMTIIDDKDNKFNDDVNHFLDLKAIIDEELNKKKGV